MTLLAAGCDPDSPSDSAPATSCPSTGREANASSRPAAGPAATRPADGKLAIVTLKYADRERSVCLPNDYGFLVEWGDTSPPQFFLYDKPRGRIEHTTDFDAFLAGLQRFPTGARVDRVDKCCAPFAWAMPDDSRKRLADVIDRKAFRLIDDKDGHFITICICETEDVALLTTVAHADATGN